MNQTRHQQLLSHIKRTIGTIIYAIDPERFHGVTVTEVLLSNDGRMCRVLVIAHEDAIKALNGVAKREIMHRFKRVFERKVVPDLQFLADDGSSAKIDQLLEATKTTPASP